MNWEKTKAVNNTLGVTIQEPVVPMECEPLKDKSICSQTLQVEDTHQQGDNDKKSLCNSHNERSPVRHESTCEKTMSVQIPTSGGGDDRGNVALHTIEEPVATSGSTTLDENSHKNIPLDIICAEKENVVSTVLDTPESSGPIDINKEVQKASNSLISSLSAREESAVPTPIQAVTGDPVQQDKPNAAIETSQGCKQVDIDQNISECSKETVPSSSQQRTNVVSGESASEITNSHASISSISLDSQQITSKFHFKDTTSQGTSSATNPGPSVLPSATVGKTVVTSEAATAVGSTAKVLVTNAGTTNVTKVLQVPSIEKASGNDSISDKISQIASRANYVKGISKDATEFSACYPREIITQGTAQL